MSFVDVDKLKVTERLPGWRGRYFHAVNMTVAHYEFTRGASIHEHHHPQEELYEVLDGELEAHGRRRHAGRSPWRGRDRAEQRAALGPGADRWAGHHRRLPGEA